VRWHGEEDPMQPPKTTADRSAHRPFARRMTACLALGATVACASAGHAQGVGCGSTVGPNTTAVLTADLDCTAATGGVTVLGPATLDLGGHAIRCAAEATRATGLALAGRRAIVRNGAVTGCRAGVEIAGDGRHHVDKLVATTNVEAAFRVDSDANLLRGNTGAGTTNGIDFVVRSDRNLLAGNTTSAENLAPAPIGFRIVGDANRLRDNTSSNHRQWGFLIEVPHERNVLQRNTANGNGSSGIEADGPRTTLTANTVLENGHEGIFVTASAARITQNEVRGNGSSGIRLFAGVGGTSIAHNTALDNDQRGLGAWDLEDGSPQCASNHWRANDFATASSGCID
jgi:parallel beta-helix repeat protein